MREERAHEEGHAEEENPIILYTIVETKLAKYISYQCENKKIPCFSILGNSIFSYWYKSFGLKTNPELPGPSTHCSRDKKMR